MAELRPGVAPGHRPRRAPRCEPGPLHVDWDLEAARKDGYDDFMTKEMHEQPKAVADTLLDRLLPDGTLVLDEVPHHQRRVPGGQQGLHRGLRQQLPRRPHGQVRHRALGPPAGRDRHRQRVPLPRPGARPTHPGHRGQPVRRDGRHLAGHARRPSGWGPRCWSSPTWSTRRWPARPTPSSTPGPAPRSAWPPPRPTWPRSPPSRSWPSTWPRSATPCRPAEARGLLDAMGVLPDKVALALEPGRADVEAVAGRYRRLAVVHLPRAATSATRWPSRAP